MGEECLQCTVYDSVYVCMLCFCTSWSCEVFSRMRSEGFLLITCSWHDLPNSAPTLPFQNKAWQPNHSTNRFEKDCFTDPTVQALKRVQSGLDLEFRALYSKHCKLPPFLRLNLECSCPPCPPFPPQQCPPALPQKQSRNLLPWNS